MTSSSRRASALLSTPGVAALVDALLIVAFVAMGRSSHDEDGSASDLFVIAAPFLIAAAVGWLLARGWNQPISLRTGTIIWLVTAALGLVLRNLVFDRGTATAFVIVTTAMLCLFLQGWRLAARQLAARAPRTP